MQKNIFLPQLELSMENVAVTKWLVQPGERVEAEQPILQIETEKAVTEVPSTDAGYLRRQFVKEGDIINGKKLLCILTDTPDEPIHEDTPESSPSPRSAADVHMRPTTVQEAPGRQDSIIRAVPAARKLARELGIDLQKVKGTGPQGRITV